MTESQQRDPFQVALNYLLNQMSYGGQGGIAEKAGIDPQYLSQLKTGARRGAEPTRRAVALALGYQYEAFLSVGQAIIEGKKPDDGGQVVLESYVPIRESAVGFIPQGGAEFATGHDDCEYAFRSDWLQKYGGPENKILIRVIGDAMDPTLKPGDMVLCDKGVTHLIAGQLYLIRLGDTAVMRRVDFSPDRAGIVLRSDNPNKHIFPDITIPFEPRDMASPLIGLLVWVGRELVSSEYYKRK
jgi:phage repressor protein C with HTH and peptisase S24 domain